MNDAQYRRIVEALEHGRRSLFRARLTAGILRFIGVLLVTVLALVVWAMIQRWFRIYNVPLAAFASLAGAGVVAFALVRWVVVPWIRMPDREAFVSLVEKRFPEERNW